MTAPQRAPVGENRPEGARPNRMRKQYVCECGPRRSNIHHPHESRMLPCPEANPQSGCFSWAARSWIILSCESRSGECPCNPASVRVFSRASVQTMLQSALMQAFLKAPQRRFREQSSRERIDSLEGALKSQSVCADALESVLASALGTACTVRRQFSCCNIRTLLLRVRMWSNIYH